MHVEWRAAETVSPLSLPGLFYNGTTGQLKCFNITSEFFECSDPTGCGTGPASISWDYQVSLTLSSPLFLPPYIPSHHASLSLLPIQACTEMMEPFETNNITDMFPPQTYDPSEYCQQIWNVKSRPGWMRTQFWGKSEYSYSESYINCDFPVKCASPILIM